MLPNEKIEETIPRLYKEGTEDLRSDALSLAVHGEQANKRIETLEDLHFRMIAELIDFCFRYGGRDTVEPILFSRGYKPIDGTLNDWYNRGEVTLVIP